MRFFENLGFHSPVCTSYFWLCPVRALFLDVFASFHFFAFLCFLVIVLLFLVFLVAVTGWQGGAVGP